MVLCNAAIPVKGKYESPSPDESALLQNAIMNGAVLLERSKEHMKISLNGELIS